MSTEGPPAVGMAAAGSPPPAAVPGNDWTALDPPADVDAAGAVSVVIEPSAGGSRAAALTAAALEGGSGPEVELIGPEEDAAPAAEVVLLLAAGTIPAPGLPAAHARWHLAVADAVSIGPATPIEGTALAPDAIRGAAAEGRLAEACDPLRLPGEEPFGLASDLTAALTERDGGVFLAAAFGPLAVRRELCDAAGGLGDARLPAELRRLDLVHRLVCAGALIVPESSRRAWTAADAERDGLARAVAGAAVARRTLEGEHPDAAALVPLEPFRRLASPRRMRRPAVVVNLESAGAAGEEVATIAAAVLGGHIGDLELRIQLDDEHPNREAIAAVAAGDPRASVGPRSTDGFCDSPCQVLMPAVALPDPRTVADLHRLLAGERVGALHVTVPGAPPDETMIEVLATPALARSRRVAAATGEGPEEALGRLFGERWVSGVEVGVRRHGVDEPHITEHGPLAAATDLGHERTQHLRFRDRADDLAARIDDQADRIVAERLRARRERLRVERLEARLRELGRTSG